MTDISGGVTVYLTGGFGNQLFGAAAGYAASQRLGCPLFLDASGLLRPSETRKFALAELDFGASVLQGDSPWFGENPGRGANSRLGKARRRMKRLPEKVWREASFQFDPTIRDITPGTTIVGYFQSYKYFADVEDSICEILSRGMERTVGVSTATAHVRRGDYLQGSTTDFHGLARPGYFENAIAHIRKVKDLSHVRVFSDSPEVAIHEIGHISGFEFFTDDHGLSDLETVREMAMGDSFVMSNSSFSWWAAWLMDRTAQDALVIAPRPWFADGTAAEDLLLPHWLTMDARG